MAIPDFCGAVFDSRQVRPGMLFVAVPGEKCDGRDYIDAARAAGAAAVVEGYEALESLARDYRRSLKAKVIGVTGSAGKTTTKELLRAMLSVCGRTFATPGNYNNHLGLPMTILNCPRDTEFLVLEMGSNHPGEIASRCAVAEPDAGAISSIGTAHIANFGSTAAIAREKGALLAAAREFGVIGADVREAQILRSLCRSELVIAGQLPEAAAAAVAAVLPGAHNLANAAVALAAARRWGFKDSDLPAALAGFALPGSRFKRVVRDGVLYVDDTYNANPEAAVAALDAFAALPVAGRRIAILGDMLELGETAGEAHARVFRHAREIGIDLVVGVGEHSAKCPADRHYADVMSIAADFGALARKGDAVLLKASHAIGLGSLIA